MAATRALATWADKKIGKERNVLPREQGVDLDGRRWEETTGGDEVL
jgi:hypothetical protein